MAVLESNQTVSNNRNGFDKEIHKSARTMMLDNIQNFIYQKPIPSCVRETVSNCVDATNEKLVALKIINGEINVSEVYKTMADVEVSKKEDNIYADSEFKRDYYDPKWLSDSNKIDIRYTSNTIIGERDMFSISDNGVGIGDTRLENIFSLGFSTKRLNTNELGGFGIGQKSALATGVSSYRMTSRHNGKRFCFDIFSHKIENINSKWNENGETNPHIEFKNTFVESGETKSVMQANGEFKDEPIMEPFKAYYTTTTEKNGTNIEFEVKPHNKRAFIDAVKSQLMYLKDDITFTVVDQYENEEVIDFKAAPIYEDDDIILSNYGHYNRPHFVIKNIAYGVIDFPEAELSPKFGNVGFKFKMEDLDVVPSRESVRYTPKTSASIVKLYDKIKKTVEGMVKSELQERKFYLWIKAANKIMHRTSGNNSQDILSRLTSLIDITELDLTFKNINYSTSAKRLLGPMFSLENISRDSSRGKETTRREETDYTSALSADTYFQFEKYSSKKALYLLIDKTNFVNLSLKQDYRYLSENFKRLYDKTVTKEKFFDDCNLLIDEAEIDDVKRKNIKEYLIKAVTVFELLTEGDLILSFDDIVVPEDFLAGQLEDSSDDDLNEALRIERYKQIIKERKANKEFHIQTFTDANGWNNGSKLSRSIVKFNELDKFVTDGGKLAYFTDDVEIRIINLIKGIRISNTNNPLNDKKLLVFKIAKSNVNQVKNIASNLEDWFYNIDDAGVLRFAPIMNRTFNKFMSHSANSNLSHNANIINESYADKLDTLRELLEGRMSIDRCDLINDFSRVIGIAEKHNHDYEVKELVEAIDNLNKNYKFPKDVIKLDIVDERVKQLSLECADFERVYGNFFKNVEIREIKEEVEIVLQAKKDQLQFKFKGLHDDFNS